MSKRLSIVFALLFAIGLGVYHFGGGSESAPALDDAPKAESATRSKSAPGTRRVRPMALTRASGIVKAQSGDPIEGALVVLTSLESEPDEESDPVHVLSDAKGEWSLEGVNSGRYSISASALGFLSGRLADVELQAQDENPGLNFTLAAGGQRFHGRVADVSGGEIEGAFVMVSPIRGLFGRGDGPSITARTDGEGRFEMQVPKGRQRIRVHHLDYTPKSAVMEFADGERERNFELTPMAVVEGFVVQEADGARVPGAIVTVVREKEMNLPGGHLSTIKEALQTVRADAEGHFRIRGLQSGTIALSAAAENLGSSEPTTLSLNIAERRQNVEVRVGEARSVHGVVHVKGDPSQPISGANIQVMGRGEGISATSDEEGRFVLHGLSDGPATISADARGFLPVFPGTRVQVSKDAPELELELDPGLAITGRIEPPEPARVRVSVDPAKMAFGGPGSGRMMMLGAGGSTQATPEGEFELAPVMPGTITLVAEADDGRAGKVEVEVTESGASEVVIRLEERASYAGRVVDARGKPVSDATVSLAKRQPKSRKVTLIVNGNNLGASSSPTSENGEFEIRGLEAGDYEISVNAPGLGTLAWAQPVDPKRPSAPIDLSMTEGESRQGEVLSVESRSGVIRGSVVNDDGSAAPDVWVTAALQSGLEPESAPKGEESRTEMVMMVASGDDDSGDPRGTLPPVLTDARGNFTIDGLRDGEYTLLAEAPGGAGRTKQKDIRPDANLSLKLAPLASVSGSVQASGMKVEGALVQVSGPVSRSGIVKGGRYEVERLDPGRYSVELMTLEGSASARFTVEAGERATVDLNVQALVRVRGRVLDTEGEPIADASIMLAGGPPRDPNAPEGEERVEISISADGASEHRTDAEGRFDIATPAGMRVLVVTSGTMPMPIAIKPVMVGTEDVDVGDIRQGDMPQGAMMGGPGGPPEGGPGPGDG
jgi:protocatechuate 3,4-dioxygenase beta subunit